MRPATKEGSIKEPSMRLRFPVAGLVLAGCLAAVPAFAANCPAKSTMMDDIVTALNNAPSCDRAMAIFEACEFGASGDVQLGAIVTQKCESDFLSRLKEPQKHTYQRELRVCDRKYRNEDGTMYRSFEAFCRAGVAQRYSRRALKTAAPAK
ncbi:hypothetical protein V1281_005933 [Nitrobacteraceae bacterium AZCC 2161]